VQLLLILGEFLDGLDLLRGACDGVELPSGLATIIQVSGIKYGHTDC